MKTNTPQATTTLLTETAPIDCGYLITSNPKLANMKNKTNTEIEDLKEKHFQLTQALTTLRVKFLDTLTGQEMADNWICRHRIVKELQLVKARVASILSVPENTLDLSLWGTEGVCNNCAIDIGFCVNCTQNISFRMAEDDAAQAKFE